MMNLNLYLWMNGGDDMRLIDADVVLQRFIWESENSGVNVVHINTIKRILKDIDTAYDMEKVVEELENIKDSYEHSCVDNFDKIYKEDEDCEV